LNPALRGKLSTYVERYFAWKVANPCELHFALKSVCVDAVYSVPHMERLHYKKTRHIDLQLAMRGKLSTHVKCHFVWKL